MEQELRKIRKGHQVLHIRVLRLRGLQVLLTSCPSRVLSSQVDIDKSMDALDAIGEATPNLAFIVRPGGTKAAKVAQRADKVHEAAALTQAKAAKMMAEATLRKAASLEYHNMLLLFTAPMDQVTTLEAQEYICLLCEEELHKLQC